MDVEFTLGIAADAAGKVVPFKNLKAPLLPSWIAEFFGIIRHGVLLSSESSMLAPP
jgi:hypothetical protein